MYNITDYSYNKAKELNVIIKPSTKKFKKIDVFDNNGIYMLSIGDSRYKDYPTYLKENGKEYADNRRRLYRIRHNKDRKITGSAGFYADKILW
jgi:hypothetical protein